MRKLLLQRKPFSHHWVTLKRKARSWHRGVALGSNTSSLLTQQMRGRWSRTYEKKNFFNPVEYVSPNFFYGRGCAVLIFTAFIGGGLGSWKSNTTGSFSSFGTGSELSNCKNEFFILKCFWPPPSSPVLSHGSDSEPARRVPKYDCASLIRNNLLLQKQQINFYLVVCASSISIKNRFGIHSPHETINKSTWD